MKSLRMLAACAALSLLGACSLFTGANAPPDTSAPPGSTAGPSAQSVQDWQNRIATTRLTITGAETAFNVFCATPSAPTFCRNPVDMAKIKAIETDLDDGLTTISDALTAYQSGGGQAALTAAMNKLSTVLNDFNNTVAAFRAGKDAPPRTSRVDVPWHVTLARTRSLTIALE